MTAQVEVNTEASSIVDYVARWLLDRYATEETT